MMSSGVLPSVKVGSMLRCSEEGLERFMRRLEKKRVAMLDIGDIVDMRDDTAMLPAERKPAKIESKSRASALRADNIEEIHPVN
jgi:hypothetical protein